MMNKMMAGWITVVVMVMMAAPGFATVINYEFESGTDAVDTGGGGFDSVLVGTGIAVTGSGAKFGTGSLRADTNSVANYATLYDLRGANAPVNAFVSNLSFSTFMKPEMPILIRVS